jgi:hypothetical protein
MGRASLVNSLETEIVAQNVHFQHGAGWVLVGDPHIGLQVAFLTSRIVFRDSSALPVRKCIVERARQTTRSRTARRLGRDLEKASRWPCGYGHNELFRESAHRS